VVSVIRRRSRCPCQLGRCESQRWACEGSQPTPIPAAASPGRRTRVIAAITASGVRDQAGPVITRADLEWHARYPAMGAAIAVRRGRRGATDGVDSVGADDHGRVSRPRSAPPPLRDTTSPTRSPTTLEGHAE
jgi:hypothetical protein